MKRRNKWLLVFVVSLIGLILAFTLAAPREPRYQGRPLSKWVADLSHPDYATQRVAQAAIREMGPDAVPFLTNSLAQRNSLSVRIYRKNLIPRKLVDFTKKILKGRTPMMESRSAALALQSLGPAATNAIPELIAAMQDPSVMVVHYAVSALSSMGTNAVPALNERLRVATLPELQFVLQAASHLGPDAAPLAPRILPFLGHTNANVRTTAAYALGRTGPAAAAIVTNVFAGTNYEAQFNGLTVLTYLGTNALFATNYIYMAAESPDSGVRAQATNALRTLGLAARQK